MRRPDATGLLVPDLTVPLAGSTTLRNLWSRVLRASFVDLLSLPLADLPGWRATRAAVAERAKREPGAVFSVLRRPNVGTLVRCIRDHEQNGLDRVLLGRRLNHVLRYELELARLEPALAGGPWTSWRARARVEGGHEVQQDAQGALFVAVAGDIQLCRADDSPLVEVEAHPDKSGNRCDLGGQPLTRWSEALRDALEVLAGVIPPLRAEMDVLLQQFVPVGFDAERHLSASYRENLGTVYLSLHPSPLTMLEAVVHEFSHNKLNALLELDPVLRNGKRPLYPSTVRPDLRPLLGVLLAVHAFAAVAHVHDQLAATGHPLATEPGFAKRRAEVIAANQDGLQTLAVAEPTQVGAEFLAELRRVGTRVS